MSTYMKGICCTLLSAVIFGFTPILVRIAYEGGANSITITFLRAWLALPLLYALMHRRHIPLRLEDSQVKHVLLLGIVGSCATTVCLYMSYNFISVGMATTLHFIYPILVSLGCVLFFRQRLQTFQLFSLILGCIGISTFMDLSFGGSFAGIALALISGFFMPFTYPIFRLPDYRICIFQTVLLPLPDYRNYMRPDWRPDRDFVLSFNLDCLGICGYRILFCFRRRYLPAAVGYPHDRTVYSFNFIHFGTNYQCTSGGYNIR